MNQLTFDFMAPPQKPAPPPPPAPDPLIAALIAAGYVANEYLAWINRNVSIPCSDLPSRMFQWPVELVDRSRREDGKSALLLNHPDLHTFPFVDQLEAATGVRPHWEELDEFGRDRGSRHRYFHAMDLLTDEHWRDMLATINFTDPDAIICGLLFRADYGGLSTKNFREVLRHIGSEEPADRSAAFLRSQDCRITIAQQGKFVGLRSKDERALWGAVHGLEDRLFRRDGNGHLRFSKDFLAEKEGAAA